MSRDNRDNTPGKLFLGNLAQDVTEEDIREVFEKHGKITNIKIINKNDNIFAFLDFEDPRDASDALKENNNRELKGKPIRLEEGNGGKKKRTEGCFNCGSLNHFAKDCTSSKRDSYRGGYQGSNYRQRSRSNDRDSRRRGGSPDRRRGGSPDRRRGGSPDRRRGGSPDRRRGGSPDRRSRRSPDRRDDRRDNYRSKPRRSPSGGDRN